MTIKCTPHPNGFLRFLGIGETYECETHGTEPVDCIIGRPFCEECWREDVQRRR